MPRRLPPVRPPSPETRPLNKLLACLPDADFNRLRPHLRTLPAKAKQVFHVANQPIRDLYFPNGGVASVTMAMNDGQMVEIATVGDEGVVGINAFYGTGIMTAQTMMQVPDTSIVRLAVEVFRQEVAHGGLFADCVRRYAEGFMLLSMQSTACLALHGVQQRCCRWLLMTHDRVRRDEFHLSHEFLAMMLGTSRQSVTIVAGTLQKAGHHLQTRPGDHPGPRTPRRGVLRVLSDREVALRPPRALAPRAAREEAPICQVADRLGDRHARTLRLARRSPCCTTRALYVRGSVAFCLPQV